jgi:hypothetical protein
MNGSLRSVSKKSHARSAKTAGAKGRNDSRCFTRVAVGPGGAINYSGLALLDNGVPTLDLLLDLSNAGLDVMPAPWIIVVLPAQPPSRGLGDSAHAVRQRKRYGLPVSLGAPCASDSGAPSAARFGTTFLQANWAALMSGLDLA